MAVTATAVMTKARVGLRGRDSGGRPMVGAALAWAAGIRGTAPGLTATGVGFLMLLVPTLTALWLDPRAIGGVPAWLKPAKFSASAAIYVLTLAWVFTLLPAWPRVRRIVERVTVTVLIAEIAIIYLQAGRGTTSHFNIATPLDATLFGIMGAAIFAQTFTSIAVAVALWRDPFADRAMGWALRLGMTITIVGALSGGIMTAGPTPDQLAAARATGTMPIAGAHTVGAPDGGPGLPGTGWSTRHGDLRVPHFVGLHALQALPLFAVIVRRRPESQRVRLVQAAAVGYGALFAWTLTQALHGLPLIPLH